MGSINLDRIRELFEDGGSELIAELTQIHSDESPKRLERLADGIKKQDRLAIQEAAHSIRSSALNVGADRVAELARKVESEAESLSPAELESLIERIRQEADGAQRELERLSQGKVA